MGFASETRTFNTFYTATHDEYVDSGEPTDQMFRSSPLVDALWKRGNAKVMDGGARLVGNVRFGFNPNTQWYKGADKLNMDPWEGLTRYAYDWRNLHAPVPYLGEDARRNKGKAQAINMVQEMERESMDTMYKVVDTAMAGDGSANNGKAILGLDAFFPTDPTVDPAAGAVGDITAVGNTYWQNGSVTSFGSFAANGPGGTSSDQFITAWDNASDGNDSPDLILSAQDVWEAYNRANLSAGQVVIQPQGSGDRTFAKLTYYGVPWYWSRNIAPGYLYMLRTADMMFIVHPDGNMKLSEFAKAFDQDLYAASLLLMCAFIVKRRLFSTVISGITA
jgi:hypothetical protein